MIFDTDVLVWVFRGSAKAAGAVRAETDRCLSVITYMELMQGVRDKEEAKDVRVFLKNLGFEMLPLTPEIGHRAALYIEEYSLKSGLRLGDALVAATAVESGQRLFSGNRRHFQQIADLELALFHL